MKVRLILLCASIAAAPVALAQKVDIQPIPDLPIRSVPAAGAPAAPAPEWKVSIGGGISDAPRYEGSSRNRLRFMPLLEATYGHFFISPLRGAGYNFSDNPDVQYGVRVAPGHPRKHDADPRLNGMGDIGYSLEPGLFLNLRAAPWYVSAGLSTGIHGSHAELGGGIGFPVSRADRVRIGANLEWGDALYNRTYFGVTPGEAVASGGVLTPYQPGSGMKDYAVTANWMHNYGTQWFTSAGASWKWLTGSDQYSPLTLRRAFGSVNILLGYRF